MKGFIIVVKVISFLVVVPLVVLPYVHVLRAFGYIEAAANAAWATNSALESLDEEIKKMGG